jgi:gamma-glutamylcyclotransferase (GGCT)/AIG2-like uncharacterized protein YtfP
MTLVFVYGTLKRGQKNRRLIEGLPVISTRFAVLRGVALFDIRAPSHPYPYPALLRGRGRVLGEVIEISNQTHPEDALMALDHLEREGHEYHRVPCWVWVRGQRQRAWVYVYASKKRIFRARGLRLQLMSWKPRRILRGNSSKRPSF